jgi:hypothetical protein
MKGLILLAAALLVGCAEVKTLEELELAALQSGDWSAVEKRERSIARRKARGGPGCPSGLIPVCERRAGNSTCDCVSEQLMQDLLRGF